MSMKPTIIFDMDGVIVRSEDLWNTYEEELFQTIVHPDIRKQIIGTTRGLSEGMIYRRLVELGHTGTKEELYQAYDAIAAHLYAQAPLTSGIDELIFLLHNKGIPLGIVSASPIPWIQIVLGRLKHGDVFSYVESVNEHPDLRPKPAPDGYIAAMKALGAKPTHTLIIEDSQTGVNAATESGAHVCCFTFHHDNEADWPQGVENYAHSTEELTSVCNEFIRSQEPSH